MTRRNFGETLVITIIGGFVVPLIFLPTRLLIRVGHRIDFEVIFKKLFFTSLEGSHQIRDDMMEAMIEGTDLILEHREIDTIPMSRHIIRQSGTQEEERITRLMSNGESSVCLFITFVAVMVTLLSVTLDQSTYISSLATIGYPITIGSLLTLASILLSFLAIAVLLLVAGRVAITEHLIYKTDEMNSKVASDLLAMAAWNWFVAEWPGKTLRAYYILWFARQIGTEVYEQTLKAIVNGMDPNISNFEAVRAGIPQYVQALKDEME